MAPTTVTGLLAQLEQDAAALPDFVKALDQLARQLPSVPPGRAAMASAAMLAAHHPRSRRPAPPPSPATARRALAGGLIRELEKAARAVPGLILACRRVLDADRVAPEAVQPVAAPLYVPDATDPNPDGWLLSAGGALDAATGQLVPYSEPSVSWWPKLSRAALDAGATLADVTLDGLDLGDWSALPDFAATYSLTRGREAGYDHTARTMRGGNTGPRRARRQAVRAAANRYTALAAWLRPMGDLLAARYVTYVSTLTASLAALADSEGFDMPTLTGSSATVTALAARIRDAITSGHGGRLAVSDSEIAFSWAPGGGATLLSYLTTATVTGRHATVVTAKNAATVVGPVAEGGPKPTVVAFTSEEVDLVKYAGLAQLSTEAAQYTSNIEPAVASVLVNQIARAIEKDAVSRITAKAGVVITAAADMTAGVLAAMAGIRENGGTPTVVGMASSDWLSLMVLTGQSGYLNFSSAENGPAGTWLGLIPVLLPGQTPGNAIVLDGTAVSVLEPAGGPLCVVDVYSMLSTNQIQIGVEEWATTQVTSPGGAASVAVTAGP